MEKLHVQPSELDMLPYYEFEYTLDIYNDIVKERNDESKKQQSEADEKYNVKSMQNNAIKNIKTPKMPNIKMPR